MVIQLPKPLPVHYGYSAIFNHQNWFIMIIQPSNPLLVHLVIQSSKPLLLHYGYSIIKSPHCSITVIQPSTPPLVHLVIQPSNPPLLYYGYSIIKTPTAPLWLFNHQNPYCSIRLFNCVKHIISSSVVDRTLGKFWLVTQRLKKLVLALISGLLAKISQGCGLQLKTILCVSHS